MAVISMQLSLIITVLLLFGLNFFFRALFEDADTDNSGTISFDELKSELEKHPGVIENLTIR